MSSIPPAEEDCQLFMIHGPVTTTTADGSSSTFEAFSGSSSDAPEPNVTGSERGDISLRELKNYSVKNVKDFPEYLVLWAFEQSAILLNGFHDQHNQTYDLSMTFIMISMNDLDDTQTLPEIKLVDKELNKPLVDTHAMRREWDQFFGMWRSWYDRNWSTGNEHPIGDHEEVHRFISGLIAARYGLKEPDIGREEDNYDVLHKGQFRRWQDVERELKREEDEDEDVEYEDEDEEDEDENKEDEDEDGLDGSDAWSDDHSKTAIEESYDKIMKIVTYCMERCRKRKPESELVDETCRFVRDAILDREERTEEAAAKTGSQTTVGEASSRTG